MADDGIRELLRLAGVPSSDEKAAAWLSNAIEGMRHDGKVTIKRPLPADHNAMLIDIEKSAKKLIKQLERLRRHPFSQSTFWRSKAFGPVYYDRVEVREVLSALEAIVRATDMAKEHRRGRRRETGKQHVVNLAFGFFEQFSPHTPSGTPTGPFGTFAHAFYTAATGVDPEQNGGLERQIRQALARRPLSAQRKSHEKS